MRSLTLENPVERLSVSRIWYFCHLVNNFYNVLLENMYVMAFCLELMEVTDVIKHSGFIHKFLLKFLSIPNAFIM